MAKFDGIALKRLQHHVVFRLLFGFGKGGLVGLQLYSHRGRLESIFGVGWIGAFVGFGFRGG